MPNFSSLANLEMTEKFVCGDGGGVGGGFQVATVSDLNPVELRLGFDNTDIFLMSAIKI